MTAAEQPVPHPESVHRHDPEINRRFDAIFAADDNVDLARMLTVGLATADPAPQAEGPVVPTKKRPAPGSVEAPRFATSLFSQEEGDPQGNSLEGIRAKGIEGSGTFDFVRIACNDGDPAKTRFLVAFPGVGGVLLSPKAVEEIADFLDDALADDEDDA